MNIIAATYFTGSVDVQRGTILKPDRIEYLLSWYQSAIMIKDIKLVIFHNQLSELFMSRFLGVKFIKTTDPEFVYYHRWFIYYDYLSNNQEIENIFFTDTWDVKVIRNPFIQPEYNRHTLYCGDELSDTRSYITSLVRDDIKSLPGYIDMIDDRRLLNCGIVGGSRSIVLKLLTNMCDIASLIYKDNITEMPIFNYVIYTMFSDVVHGFPVNSIFNKYENRQDVWFIHK